MSVTCIEVIGHVYFVTGINLAHIPTIFLLDFETVLTVFLLNILLNFYSSIINQQDDFF
jgi:hypothetical protein